MQRYLWDNWEILNTDWILYHIKDKILGVILLWLHFYVLVISESQDMQQVPICGSELACNDLIVPGGSEGRRGSRVSRPEEALPF